MKLYITMTSGSNMRNQSKLRHFFIFIICALLLLAQDTSWAIAGWESVVEDPNTVLIKDSFGRCTGTKISKEGHILTARHCFNGCLISENYVASENLFPEFGWRSPKLHRYHHGTRGVCRKELNGVETDLEVILGSEGFMIPSEQSSLSVMDYDVYLDLLENRYFHNGDFIIVKAANTQFANCRRVSEEEIKIGQPVHYYGYPSATTGRTEGRNSDGMKLFKGEGQIKESILMNPCLSSIENQTRLSTKYDRPELVLSTVDLVPGSSGASLLNASGEIIGLLNSSYSRGFNVNEKYCPGSAVAVKMSEIMTFARERLSVDEVQEIFNCSIDQN